MNFRAIAAAAGASPPLRPSTCGRMTVAPHAPGWFWASGTDAGQPAQGTGLHSGATMHYPPITRLVTARGMILAGGAR